MNIKKITLSFMAITLSMALLQFSISPLALAVTPIPTVGQEISGLTIDSQGNEPGYFGGFTINMLIVTPITDTIGTFEAGIGYTFVSGLSGETLTNIGGVAGIYKVTNKGLQLQFSGIGDNGNIRGQLKNDGRYPLALIGFINTPGNGYLSQVFVAGCDMADELCTTEYVPATP